MRAHAGRDRSGKTLNWRIIYALTPFTREVPRPIQVVSTLTPEHAQLSIYELWPHPVIVKELGRGWTPARAEELRLRDMAEQEAEIAQNPPKATLQSERLRHYLYFPERSNAEKAAQWFRSQGLTVEVRLGADHENWLALVKHGPLESSKDLKKLRDEMEALAERLHGEYDGWEGAV
jgi:hypothetical protein